LKLSEVIPEFRQIAQDKATTMGHIKRHHMDDVFVQVPPKAELDEFDRAFEPLWDRMVGAEIEALTLQSLRDVLLPELLSGRLRLSGPEGPDPAS
jgi:type I restriction enzyme S subunit